MTRSSLTLSTMITASAPAFCAWSAFAVNAQLPRSRTTTDAPWPGVLVAVQVSWS